jgi:hypothetical protein
MTWSLMLKIVLEYFENLPLINGMASNSGALCGSGVLERLKQIFKWYEVLKECLYHDIYLLKIISL